MKIKTLIGVMVAEGEDYKDVDMSALDAEGAPAAAAAIEQAGDKAEGVSDTTEFMSMRHAVGKDS